jgi:hypothetical protein
MKNWMACVLNTAPQKYLSATGGARNQKPLNCIGKSS